MYAIQRQDLKGQKIPVLIESDSIEDYINLSFPVKAEQIETDHFYNVKLHLENGTTVIAQSIDLDFPNIVLGDESEELLTLLLKDADWKKADKIQGLHREGNSIIAFDNTSGECYVEEIAFDEGYIQKAIVLAYRWLSEEIDLEDIDHDHVRWNA